MGSTLATMGIKDKMMGMALATQACEDGGPQSLPLGVATQNRAKTIGYRGVGGSRAQKEPKTIAYRRVPEGAPPDSQEICKNVAHVCILGRR